MLKESIVKYRFFLFALIVTISFIFYYSHVFKVDFDQQTEHFQTKFTEQEQKLDLFLQEKKFYSRV